MTVLEVSIIGGDFGRFFCQEFQYDKGCPYVYLDVENYEKPILVKILRFRKGKKDERLLNAKLNRMASPKEVERMMLNMVKGVVWENGLTVKIKEGNFDAEKGILRVEYVADKQVDLKKVVQFLVNRLHVRIEFVFVDTVKYASKVGWLEKCGLELCCKVFLKDIPKVSQDMAKRQYLFAAPDRLTGVCGRLLCCLAYELPFYDEMSNKVPRLNSIVRTERGEGKVIEINLIAGYYIVAYQDGRKEKVRIEA